MRLLSALGPLALLGACTFNATNIFVEVYPDRTGKVRLSRISPAETGAREELLRNLRNPRSGSLRYEHHEAYFEDVNELRIADIRYAFRELDRGFEVTVRIPTHGGAGWYDILGFRRRELDALTKLFEKMGRDEVGKSADRVPSAVFRVTMPAEVVSNSLQDLDLPEDWRLLVESRRLIGGAKNSAVLVIPLESILEGKIRSVVWKVRCGSLSDADREAWEKHRKEMRGE